MTASLTIIRYPKRFILFGLLSMIIFRLPLLFNKRCRFWKLMGSGKNGSFDKKPDWQQWAILSVSALRFKQVQIKHYKGQVLMQKLYGVFISKWLNLFNCETITYLLESIEGHGLWDGKSVFGELPKNSDYDGQIAILTRATIRPSKQKLFWQHVKKVSAQMANVNGLIASYGIGEVPLLKQATFSVWDNKNAVNNFAYNSPQHQEVIQKTRDENWYSEDMFVRFKINACIGTVKGTNPLKGKL
jgi:heme-degrading monooxygenase HmoA